MLAQGAQARVTVTIGRATAVHSVARLGVRTALPVEQGRPPAARAPPQPRAAPRSAAAARRSVGRDRRRRADRPSELQRREQPRQRGDQLRPASSSRPTRACASATASCSSRSTRPTPSTTRTGRRSPARSTSTTRSTRALREFTSDPRCYFDPATNTWFATILFLELTPATTASTLDIAVNTSGDPTTALDRLPDRHHATPTRAELGCPCFGDQPRLGIDAHNLYVTTDEFSILGPEFNGAQIYAIAKQDLVVGRASAHFVHFANLTHRRRTRRSRRSRRSPPGQRDGRVLPELAGPERHRRQPDRRVGAHATASAVAHRRRADALEPR